MKTTKQHNISFEITFFEKLIATHPNFIDALIPLAHAYTTIGDHKKGLEIDKKLCRLKPHNEIVFYNLACSYALLAMMDEAFTALHKSINLGYKDISHLQKDPDLISLRNDIRFGDIMKMIVNKNKGGTIAQY